MHWLVYICFNIYFLNNCESYTSGVMVCVMKYRPKIIYDSMQYSVCSATALITTDNYLSSINKRQFVFKGPRHICYAK